MKEELKKLIEKAGTLKLLAVVYVVYCFCFFPIRKMQMKRRRHLLLRPMLQTRRQRGHLRNIRRSGRKS